MHYKDAGMTFQQAQAHNRACDRSAKAFDRLFGGGLCLIVVAFGIILAAAVLG